MKFLSPLLFLLIISCADTEEPADTTTDEELPQTKEEAALLTNEGKGDFSLDICKKFKWYDDGNCDWFCPARDGDCNADPLGPDPIGQKTKFPIILAHGFMGSPTNFWAFLGVKEALEADGNIVIAAEVPPFHSSQVRGGHLGDAVDEVLTTTGATKVNIIAHSMGGLDARFLASPGGLDFGDKIASITTISSPHQGAKIADVGLKLTPQIADKALDALLGLVGRSFSNNAEEASFRESLASIAVSKMGEFNENTPDHSSVFYQSWAGISSVTGIANRKASDHCDKKMLLNEGTYDHADPLLWATLPFAAEGTKSLPNDGLVSVQSAKWGEFKGCIPADHLDEVGQISDESDLDTGFDHIRFYRNLADDLAQRGF